MAESKYGKYVVTIPFHKTPAGALFSTGADVLGGLELNVIYACAYQTGITGLSTKPHVHNYDEAVFFIGSDPRHLGKEEKHTFDKPTVLVAPKGLYHCPIVTKRIDKPYVCMAVSLTGQRTD